jgi:hypothetical protein
VFVLIQETGVTNRTATIEDIIRNTKRRVRDMMTTMQILEEKRNRNPNPQRYNDEAQPEHIKHASLFSIEQSICASSSSRSLCLCSAAANSGSISAADLVLSARDKEAVVCSSEAALGGGETRPLLMGGGVSEGVMGSCLIVAEALARAGIRTGEGDGDGKGLITPPLLALFFFSTTAEAAFVFAVFASFRTLWSTVN